MKPAPLCLKQPSGWFAAGREVAEALTLLSDAAFKLFMWICLHADRRRGAFRVDIPSMARELGRTEAETARILEDLFLQEICSATADGWIEVRDRFWPYQRPKAGLPSENAVAYVAQVKRLMLAHDCVRSAFSAADHRLAVQLHERGIPLEQVQRAIHLGCLRKYAGLLNRAGGDPITTLYYFASLLEEVRRLDISPDYWRYVTLKLERVERQWRQSHPPAPTKPGAAQETK
jgi:hypothetical protein